MKLNVKVSKPAVVAAVALAGVLTVGYGLTGRAAAQTAAAKPKNAGETFKNVTSSLKTLTVDDFMAAMGVISADLGLDCADCHPGAGSDKVNWVIDTPQKVTARKMIEMVQAINKTNFNGVQNVTCWTCHHGREMPSTSIKNDFPPNDSIYCGN